MAKYTLKELQSLPDPLFSDNFKIEIPSMPISLSPFDGMLGSALSIKDSSTVLSMSCKTASLPAKTIEPSVVELYGHKLKYAGLANFNGTFDIEFHENQTMIVTKILHAWMDVAKVHSSQAGHFKGKKGGGNKIASKGGDNGYATSIRLYVFDTSGKQTGLFTINGAWPCDIGNIGFDGSAANPITVSASFCFDYWEENPSG